MSKPLTPAMRTALRHASRKGGVHVGTGRLENGDAAPEKRCVKPVAGRLIALGLATQHADTLLITKTGRAALTAVLPEDPPVYLRLRDGLTHMRHNAVQDAGEVVDPATLDGYWAEQSERQHAAARDKRAEARKLADRARRAA